jgi:hypothetical protein
MKNLLATPRSISLSEMAPDLLIMLRRMGGTRIRKIFRARPEEIRCAV